MGKPGRGNAPLRGKAAGGKKPTAKPYSKKEAHQKHKRSYAEAKKQSGGGSTYQHKHENASARQQGRSGSTGGRGDRRPQQTPRRKSDGASQTGGRGQSRHPPKSHAVANIDIHAAAKVTADLRADISRFKERRGGVDVFGPALNSLFALVPPNLVAQHLPEEVEAFRSYMTKFNRGAANAVDAFIKWYEWASLELNRGKHSQHKPNAEKVDEEEAADAAAAAKAEEGETKAGQRRGTQRVLAQAVKDREHVRALLQMCLRFNHTKRKEGQHALVNYVQAQLSEEGVSARTLEELKATAHPSIAYAVSRLVLGMSTEDISTIVLYCQALYLLLSQTPLGPQVVLDVIAEDLALPARMQLVKQRLRRQQPGETDGEEEVDPDDVSDPTRGERNQKMTAAVFALCALVAARDVNKLSPIAAVTAAQFLSFCYVEQKATRVVSANLLLKLLKPAALGAATDNDTATAAADAILANEECLQWISFAFFHIPKMEYYRPEGIQMLLFFMGTQRQVVVDAFPETFEGYIKLDPLEPTVLEQITNALFRNEQVTAVHPMVHPVWDDLFDLVIYRCRAGESMKEHLSTLTHTVIVPYRRGAADVPRRALFQNLVRRLGQIAVGADDAADRAEMLKLASTNVGYGERTSAKPTPLSELKDLPPHVLKSKVEDLVVQFRNTRDRDPAAATNRNWVLQELKACLLVPMHSSADTSYVDVALNMLFEYGFFPPRHMKHEAPMNRCVFLFADVFSFTFDADVARPKSQQKGLDLIATYLKAEERQLTRYNTAVNHSAFRKGRNRIVEVLEGAGQRSVLFYDFRDMEIMLTLLFLVLSADDPTNEEARVLASQTVPDLAVFVLTGTLESIRILVDVLMSIVMRTSAPVHVMPLMTCIRRIAKGYLLRFARHFNTKQTLNLVLSPLREAYGTDVRELARQKKGEAVDSDAEADGDNEEEDPAAAADGDEEHEDSAGDNDSSSSGSSGSSDDDSDSDGEGSTDKDGENEEEDEEDDAATEASDAETDNSTAAESAATDSEDDEDDIEEDEPATEEYISTLKKMVGNIDLDHKYPQDTANKEKSDVVRAVQLSARTGLQMRSPVVIDIFQVLLGVCRENVKAGDDTVFNSALSSIDMLLLSKNRYFGHFCQPVDLFQILGDIQSYVRKLESTLVKSEKSPKAAAAIRRRFAKLKRVSLRVFHYLCMLAYKNHAGEDVRLTLSTYYSSIFCDRGWDTKKLLPDIKRDLYHYRQGFAWAVLPAALDKFAEVSALPGAQRYKTFAGCCALVEAMLPRLSGLKGDLKSSCGTAICDFLQSVTLSQVYEIKHTLPFNYLHCVKMVLQYNSRVGLSTEWAAALVAEAIDTEELQLSGASVRVLASMERLLDLTPRARETKAPVPVKVLFQQFEKRGAAEKSEFYRKAKVVRSKILKSVLAYRNHDATDEERAAKRRRKEEMRVEDRLQRQMIREKTNKTLSKEEREEKRKRIMVAKQERIAKNRERKRRLFEARKAAFAKWRAQKLAEARNIADDDDDDDE